MSDRGHNQPPSMIELVDQVATDISAWLSEHPVIANEDEAREAKVQLDRGKLSLRDLEDERDGRVRPLNEQVKEINNAYRPAKTVIGAVIQQVGERISDYIRAEEKKKQEAAREAARLAAEAELRAREAERLEREAADAVHTGELGVDVKAVTVAADSAFADFQKAERAAQIAEKETHVKVGGGFSRATSLRKVKVYLIEDPAKALYAIGLTDAIRDAIVKGAKEYHEEYGEIPPGILVYTERKL